MIAALAVAASAVSSPGELRLEDPARIAAQLRHHDRHMDAPESPERFLERAPGHEPRYYDKEDGPGEAGPGDAADEPSDVPFDDTKDEPEGEDPSDGDNPNDGASFDQAPSRSSRGLRDAGKTFRFRGQRTNMRALYFRFQELTAKTELTVEEHEELEAMRRRGFFKSIAKIGKKVFKGVGKLLGGAAKVAGSVVGAVVGGGIANGGKAKLAEMLAQDVEDCVACRFVWLGVELEVGNSQMEESVYDAFVKRCMEAEKAPIFFQACQDMFDDVYGMIGDYMNGYTVNQVCEGAKLCR